MIKINNLSIGVACLLLFASCTAQKPFFREGFVLYKVRMLDIQTNTFIRPLNERDRKAWYKDSLIITEGSHVDITHDGEKGKVNWKTYIGEYTFINLKTKSFFEYLTLSDTARIIDSYKQPDSGRNKRGWNFFSLQTIFSPETLRYISDTTIGGISYKRIMSTRTIEVTDQDEQKIFGTKHFEVRIGYLRTDLKTPLFSLDKYIQSTTGYPVVRLDIGTLSTMPRIITEIEYFTGKLTTKERRVFDAWEKNAKQNPVLAK